MHNQGYTPPNGSYTTGQTAWYAPPPANTAGGAKGARRRAGGGAGGGSGKDGRKSGGAGYGAAVNGGVISNGYGGAASGSGKGGRKSGGVDYSAAVNGGVIRNGYGAVANGGSPSVGYIPSASVIPQVNGYPVNIGMADNVYATAADNGYGAAANVGNTRKRSGKGKTSSNGNSPYPVNGGSNGSYPPAPPSGSKKSLKWQLIKVLLILVVLGTVGVGGYIWKVQSDVRPYAGVFLDNISVDGIRLDGMTWQEGSAAVWAQANAKQSSWYVRLRNNVGEYKDITAQTLGIAFDPTAALEEAWAIGHSGDASGRVDVFKMRDAIQSAKSTPHAFYSAEQSGDLTAVEGILDTLSRAAYKPASDAALLSFNPDDTLNPFTFQSEVYGQWLDVASIREQITRMVQTLESGEILLEPQTIAPSITVADLQKTVELRCRAVTPISKDSTDGRTNNIRIAFGKINGMVLKDGAKFSFNSAVGKRNEANGFFQAIEYAYGQEVLGWGGGVCQASTTVYIAAIQSGMTISKRSAHSNPVSYTDMGKDATVNDTKGHEVDFVFRNNSGAPVYISAHVIQSGTSRKSLLCEVRIYGQSLGGTRYELETEVVQTLPKPAEPTLVEDETGAYVTYDDEKKLMSKGREGYVVDAYLCTVTDGIQVSREKVSTDTYPERADRYWVGTVPRISY